MLSWLPNDVSTYGHGIDHVMRIIYYTFGAALVLAEAVLIGFLVRYRRRTGVRATYQAGTRWKALAWILVPATIVLGLDLAIDVVQSPVWDQIKIFLPVADQTVRINARQYAWDVVQPGADGALDTPDDIKTDNVLTVPAGKKIVFELTASDVIHSLWIPNLRLKQDAVPGRTIRGWFEATTPGNYPIGCAQLCGVGHGLMKGELHVLAAADYQSWIAAQTTKGALKK